MRTFLVLALAALLLSGCGSLPDQRRNALAGAIIGTGVGALIGSAAVGGPTAIIVGAAIGGTAGGVIGSLVRPPACYFRNKRGEIWQVPCEDPRIKGAEACYVGRLGGLQEVYCPWASTRHVASR